MWQIPETFHARSNCFVINVVAGCSHGINMWAVGMRWTDVPLKLSGQRAMSAVHGCNAAAQVECAEMSRWMRQTNEWITHGWNGAKISFEKKSDPL